YLILQTLVLRVVQKWTPDALVSPDAADGRKSQIAELMTQLGTIAADRAAIQAELDRPGRAASTAAILASRLDALDNREAELKEALADLEGSAGVSATSLRDCQSLAATLDSLPPEKQPEARRRLNARLQEVLEGVWLYRHRITPRTAEVIVQIWPRAGQPPEGRLFVGKPPDRYQPHDTRGADFRQGYPAPLTKAQRKKT